MIDAVEDDYRSVACKSIENLREEFSTGKTRLTHRSIETR